MRVRQVLISCFRGWRELNLRPGSHALVTGEPRAGRSDLIEALRRVLDPDSTRTPPNEFDVYLPSPTSDDSNAAGSAPDESGDEDAGDDQPEILTATVELVLADLGGGLEQHFFRHLELWDKVDDRLVADSTAEEIDEDRHDLVLRLRYRLHWRPEEGVGEHWVEYPKTTVPEDDSYDRARRADRLVLPFVHLQPGQPLTLRSGSAFRDLLDIGGDDLSNALGALSVAVDTATDGLSATDVVGGVLDDVFEPVRSSLGMDSKIAIEDVVSFRAEGGSVAGLLRALQPALRLGTPQALPLRRHGSTTQAILAAAEALLAAQQDDAVVVCDDFGDQLDAGAAEYLARELRRSCGQLWLSTRRPEAARSFRPPEVIRLSRRDGERAAYQLADPKDRHELVAMRQLHLQLLPAMSSQTVVVFEGPHDVAALYAISERRRNCIPAAHRIRLVDAGGHGGVPKVCALARNLGFRVIAALDYDAPGAGADMSFEDVQKIADEVVRLPMGFAIERALVHGVERDVLLEVAGELDSQWGLGLSDLDKLNGDQLAKKVEKALKQKSGLHAQYVNLLPKGSTPAVALSLLQTSIELARGIAQGPVTLTI